MNDDERDIRLQLWQCLTTAHLEAITEALDLLAPKLVTKQRLSNWIENRMGELAEQGLRRIEDAHPARSAAMQAALDDVMAKTRGMKRRRK